MRTEKRQRTTPNPISRTSSIYQVIVSVSQPLPIKNTKDGNSSTNSGSFDQPAEIISILELSENQRGKTNLGSETGSFDLSALGSFPF